MSDPKSESQNPNPKLQKADAVSDGLTTTDGGPQTVSPPAKPTPPAVPAPSAVGGPPSKVEPLELPKGALIAYRKSGGLKFSSREIVVYPDGRVTFGGGDTAKTALESRATRKLMDAQIMKMRRTLDQSGFWKMKAPAGKHGGDAYAMEIVARVGANSNQMELFTGGVPDSLM